MEVRQCCTAILMLTSFQIRPPIIQVGLYLSFFLKLIGLDIFVGLLLPQDLDQQHVDKFHEILNDLTQLRDQEITKELSVDERKSLSSKIASFLVKGKLSIFACKKTYEHL